MNSKDVEVFLMVTQTRSLTQAARRLNTTPMTVSRRLASLEEDLGVRLLHRTTRAIALTDEGEEFLPYAKTLTETEQSARNLFSPDKQGATGQLRITAPSGFGRRTIIPLLPALMAENPELKIDFQLSDNVTDIVGLGYDVAIRIAPLRDSRLVAQRLADNPRVLCASPDYLARFGTPQLLADLHQHNCLRLSGVPQWSFMVDDHISSVSVEGRFSGSNVEGVRTLCVAGSGIAQLSAWDVQQELAAGELIEIALRDAQPQLLGVWALFPTARHLPTRVTVFLNALKQAMA
ncbi:DNA-binding transcriptional regulator, LysR family [Candidatus Pantoea symbiotica]|jgi:DNA-binding transcriptional LysR family regulator|uniref:DNA-binding transcriptional regulator, LysR family n=1 Tax=Candidatus Pantoea symbiotica TaxID=1884370 RepID=A0A1I3TZA0_9GAMM|nr:MULTISPECIES: LysR family transcriptional regulator [Pantoea]KAJ9433107.1 LysR family transcriptional regulator [Pantoea sp. YR343]MRT25418.1 LysR family transcriptional regulator [Enterobacteriaceae bacterium RIT697]SFJ75813.1 DNA-binding transcriptional regulator, LysR family [Pantoea symbiotica]SFU45644.1 DNA-binding transcriptional regulator, LysR family [Pantoea sp. YR525]